MIPANFVFERSKHLETFDFFARTTIAAGLTLPAVSGLIPKNCQRGFITLFGIEVELVATYPNPVLDTALSSIRVNGFPDRFYQNINGQLGKWYDPTEIMPIPVKPGDTIDVLITNGDVAPHLYSARLCGFVDYQLIKEP